MAIKQTVVIKLLVIKMYGPRRGRLSKNIYIDGGLVFDDYLEPEKAVGEKEAGFFL